MLPSVTRPWSDMGHRYTGILAYEYSSNVVKNKVLRIAQSHPEYNTHFLGRMPDDVSASDTLTKQCWIFSQLACWPDVIKSSELHYSPQRRKWHYINIPLFLEESDRRYYFNNPHVNLDTAYNTTDNPDKWNIIQALKYCTDSFESAPDSMKAIYLCWFFHLIGDLAQPLHSSALFNELRFLTGDAGGNAITVKGLGVLHVVWDHATYNAQSKAWKFSDYINYCDTALYVASSNFTVDQPLNLYVPWMFESHQLADSIGYPDELLVRVRNSAIEEYGFGNPLKTELEKAFVTAWKKKIVHTSNLQISKAGLRIAQVITSILN